MKKIYKIKVEEKAYEVELEEVKTVEGNVVAQTQAEQAVSAAVASSGNSVDVKAPMPGVIDIKVNVGDKVSKGQVIAILEAMKMETEIFADTDGEITSIKVAKDANVSLDDLIMTIN